MSKKRIITIILAVLAVIFAVLAMREGFKQKNAGSQYEELKEEAKVEEEVEEEATPEVTKAPADTPAPTPTEAPKDPIEVPIDFKALQEINKDVYAWITVPGTEVDYPILQSSNQDTEFYLHRDINGNDEYAGSIFTENYNTKTFEDPNTVIYGHAMKNGTMFQTLKRYMDPEFFQENKEVIIYMPDKILHYQIYAAYPFDDRHLLHAYDFSKKTVFQNYLDEIKNLKDMSKNYDDSIEVTADDKIITLSTCLDANSVARYLVQAVLVEVEE